MDALHFPQPTRSNRSLEKSLEFDRLLNWNVDHRSRIILRGKYSISLIFWIEHSSDHGMPFRAPLLSYESQQRNQESERLFLKIDAILCK